MRCSGLASYKANYFTNHVFVVTFKSVAVYIVAYVEIVRIPEGAMHIRISESQLSKNYLGNTIWALLYLRSGQLSQMRIALVGSLLEKLTNEIVSYL